MLMSKQQSSGTDRSDDSDEEEMSIAKADAMVPTTWDKICGMTEEDSLRLAVRLGLQEAAPEVLDAARDASARHASEKF